MIRAGLVFIVVVMAQLVLGATLGWLAHWRTARWVHVACVVNSVLFACLLLTIQQFREDGLTPYSLFFGGMMVWLASAAARMGVVGFRTIQSQVKEQPSRSSGSATNR